METEKETFRCEADSIGTKQVPKDVYYGVQTMRAAENFYITGLAIHGEIIRSLAQIKKAAAMTNGETGLLDQRLQKAIMATCDEIIDGNLWDAFIVDPIQGGAGTSLNMNANEVIANRAIELLGGDKGDYTLVHPNDHVNYGQSTNDVVPTAGKITAIRLLENAKKQLVRLVKTLEEKGEEFNDIVKMGRTQLQDAVPIRLGQEFSAYASALRRDIQRMETAKSEMYTVNLGGTAIGTGLNAHRLYVHRIVPNLCKVTGLPLVQAQNLVDSTQNLDEFVAVSGSIKACAVTLSKIANDLRLMSSGPCTGIGEINLPPRQNGSSIMPGKINPVIPEVVNQVAFNIIGNDVTITMAAEAGQFELNAFEPIVFYCLFQSIDTLAYAVSTFVDNCVSGITANAKRCRELLDKSAGVVTALCPYIGYQTACSLAKQALAESRSVKEVALEQKVLDEELLDRLLDPAAMTYMPT